MEQFLISLCELKRLCYVLFESRFNLLKGDTFLYNYNFNTAMKPFPDKCGQLVKNTSREGAFLYLGPTAHSCIELYGMSERIYVDVVDVFSIYCGH